jgi:hypothetical protein
MGAQIAAKMDTAGAMIGKRCARAFRVFHLQFLRSVNAGRQYFYRI